MSRRYERHKTRKKIEKKMKKASLLSLCVCKVHGFKELKVEGGVK